MSLDGAICGLSYEEGFIWDRELAATLSPGEIHGLADMHRQQLKDFVREDAEHGTVWSEARIAEVSAQIDLFEKLES
jgi:hypothetical protein